MREVLSVTVTVAEPAAATSEAGTWAVSCVALTKVVASDEPFHSTVAPEVKFEPETVRANALLPTVVEVGDREVRAGGEAGRMVKTAGKPGLALGLTIVMLAVPGVAMSEAGTWAVNCVELTNVVTSGVPFH